MPSEERSVNGFLIGDYVAVDRKLKPPASFLHSSNNTETLGQDIFLTHSNILSYPHLFWKFHLCLKREERALQMCMKTGGTAEPGASTQSLGAHRLILCFTSEPQGD